MTADEARKRAASCRRRILLALAELTRAAATASQQLGEYEHVARVDMAVEVAPLRAHLDRIAAAQAEHAAWMDWVRRLDVAGETD